MIQEPLGGAHRDFAKMAATLKTVLTDELQVLRKLPLDKLLMQRYQKFMAMGACD